MKIGQKVRIIQNGWSGPLRGVVLKYVAYAKMYLVKIHSTEILFGEEELEPYDSEPV